jgi:hypothetical protein
MNEIHSIRLAGPWQLTPLAQQQDNNPQTGPVPLRGTVGEDWSKVLAADFQGQVEYRRLFHLPSGLEAGDQLMLAFDQLRGAAKVSLNDKPLGTIADAGSARFEVSGLLENSNTLVVVVDAPAPDHAGDITAGGITGDVRLEIITGLNKS